MIEGKQSRDRNRKIPKGIQVRAGGLSNIRKKHLNKCIILERNDDLLGDICESVTENKILKVTMRQLFRIIALLVIAGLSEQSNSR